LLPRLLTLMRFGLAGAVLAMSALGFVGVGLQPPTPELGVMMIELLPYYREAPGWSVRRCWCCSTLLGLLLLSPQKEAGMNAQAPVPALCVQDLAVLHGEDVLVDAPAFPSRPVAC
jgi:hypothetical protein